MQLNFGSQLVVITTAHRHRPPPPLTSLEMKLDQMQPAASHAHTRFSALRLYEHAQS